MNNLLSELKSRGFIFQISDEANLCKRLAHGSTTLYCGFDPTADSLHIGHLLPILCLKWFQDAGHTPVALTGGATGLIGDPSEKATERVLNSPDIISQWVKSIKCQISPFLDFSSKENSALSVDNSEWFSGMGALEFLRNIGKHFSVNSMVQKESVKKRFSRKEQGISFTEFSYSLLQSYDFAALNKNYNVELQIGGSDQWGNITSGIELTRKLNNKQVFGLTVPLVTKADGKKFGKTESGTIWLNAKKTSPYSFYQFWLNTSDEDVYNFLKLFTFLSLDEIENIKNNDRLKSKPLAQKILADLITELVHGKSELINVKKITQAIFKNELSTLSSFDFNNLVNCGIPNFKVTKELLYLDLSHLLVRVSLADSLTKARQLISSGSIYINDKKQNDVQYKLINEDLLYGEFTTLRKGKKNYCLVHWE